MKTTELRNASRLLETYDKIEKFLSRPPSTIDRVSFTFTHGRYTKTMSFNDEEMIEKLKEFLADEHDHIGERLYRMGVSVGEPNGE